jgi:hypothetical protein
MQINYDEFVNLSEFIDCHNCLRRANMGWKQSCIYLYLIGQAVAPTHISDTQNPRALLFFLIYSTRAQLERQNEKLYMIA